MVAHTPAPPSGYQQGYAQPYAAPPMATGTNGLAIASLICAFVFPLVGVILGHIALNQIKQTGQEGRGLAIAGLAIGYSFIGLGLIFVCFYIVVLGVLLNSAGGLTTYLPFLMG
jgi:peptidyl-prolyl cis-trans isomerase B (cyclophilin B)